VNGGDEGVGPGRGVGPRPHERRRRGGGVRGAGRAL